MMQVQYPNCLPTMMLDLKHIRVFAGYLRKTEIKFDLVSAVDELATQVRKEFDFEREALIMDAVADNLQARPCPTQLLFQSAVVYVAAAQLRLSVCDCTHSWHSDWPVAKLLAFAPSAILQGLKLAKQLLQQFA